MKKLTLFFAFAICSAMAWGTKYTLITSTDDMKSGDKIVIACSKKGVVAGALSGTNMPSVDATFAEDLSYLTTTEAYEYTINGGGTSWVLSNDNGVIGCTAAKNALTTDGSANKYSSNWEIEEISGGDVKYLCKSNNYKNTYLQFNASAKYFANYESKQTAIQFYKKATADDDTPSIECATTVDFGQLSLSNGSANAEQKLVVEGLNLTNNISVNLTSGADNFTISSTQLATTGGTLTINFTAAQAGTYSGSLNLQSGAVEVDVTLTAAVKEEIVTGGTKEAPYTCGDVISMAVDNAETKAWVVGYILGSAATGPVVATSANGTSLLLADDMQGTHPIAVQLPSGNIRTELNVVDNPKNIGRQIKVYGSLMLYFKGSGVKNTSDYEWVGDAPIDEPVVVTGVSLSESALTLTEGETATLIATITPADADDKSVTWTSSDEAVATVTANGEVTAIAEGKAVITVTTNDGGFTATCEVTVKSIPDGVEEIFINGENGENGENGGNSARKVLRDGHVIIVLPDGKTYNTAGTMMTH